MFTHEPHPRTLSHPGPVKHKDASTSLGDRIGLKITAIVGTMLCALVFALLAFVSLPAAFASHDTVIIVAWIAQTFLQLVLLPIIIVGQNVQSKAADKRSEQTYTDAEAILHECLQLQKHLADQDKILEDLIKKQKDVNSA